MLPADAPDERAPHGDSGRRLARALQLGLAFRAAGRTDVTPFLAEHAELGDLLTGILRGGSDGGGGDAGTGPERAPVPGDGAAIAGTAFGDYRLVREIGRGGMGVVYEAEQTLLGRRVALKMLQSSGPLRERMLWRFQREARLLGVLEHPGIVKVFDAGTVGATPYYAMELIDGASLSRVLEHLQPLGAGRLDGDALRRAFDRAAGGDGTAPATAFHVDYAQSVANVVARVADALACAHAAGVVHRDVKPANILIRRDGQPILTDFGVARLEAGPALTLTGDFAGTPHYVSPEQARGGAVDHRSDVFALGVTLFELLTLRRPFSGETTQAVLASVQRDEPGDPSRFSPGLASDLAAIAQKALAKEPRDRYQGAGELAADLRRWLAGMPIQARRPTRRQRLRAWARREPWRAAAVGVAAAALLILAGVSIAFTQRVLAESERKSEALAEVARLGIGIRLDRAEAAARSFRAEPRFVEPMLAWLTEHGEPLAGELQALRELQGRLRAEADPYGEREAAAAATSRPEAEQLRRLEAEWQYQQSIVDGGADAGQVARAKSRLESLAGSEPALRQRLAERREWHFQDQQRQFLHDQVTALIERLNFFAESPDGTLARVRADVAWTSESRERCLERGAEAWRDAAAAIASSPRYGGLHLPPQRDLLPLGADPGSGLWEFVHLRSGTRGAEVPARGADGRLQPAADDGLVLVLIPGGRFTMGAQRDDPAAAGYDPQTGPYEGPPHEVALQPFFLSKYEMTQAQWLRLAGANPSTIRVGNVHPDMAPITSLHPVESVSWFACEALLQRHGLVLPTEAQWEYACRAGTTSAWSFGDRADATRFCNIADAVRARAAKLVADTDLDDGFIFHAPVGTFAANAFGLHDMHGNVSEWTRDGMVRFGRPRLADGAIVPFYTDPATRSVRGGSYATLLIMARSASRQQSLAPDVKIDTVGVRPARAIEE